MTETEFADKFRLKSGEGGGGGGGPEEVLPQPANSIASERRIASGTP